MVWETFDYKSGRTCAGRKLGKIFEGNMFPCSFCSGTGMLPRSKNTKCPVCKGQRMVSVTGPVMVCAYCRGRGEFPRRTNITCTVCKGTGFVSIKKPIETCEHCHGTGAEPGNKLPCLTCRGKGVITKKLGLKP